MVNLRVFSEGRNYDFSFTEEQLETISQLRDSIERNAERKYPRHNFYCFEDTIFKEYFIDDRKVSEREYEEAQDFEIIGQYLRKREIGNTFKKILLSMSEMGIIERTEFEFLPNFL